MTRINGQTAARRMHLLYERMGEPETLHAAPELRGFRIHQSFPTIQLEGGKTSYRQVMWGLIKIRNWKRGLEEGRVIESVSEKEFCGRNRWRHHFEPK